MEQQYYYIDKNGQQQGAVSGNELIKSGITRDTKVWKQGMADWQEAGTLSELSDLLPPAISKTPPPINNPANDIVIYSGMANHFLNAESVGGNLFLYSDRLYFKSHAVNIQVHDLTIELNQIKNVSYYNTLGLIPNGLAVNLHNGKTEKFVLYKRAVWQKEIENFL